MKRYYDTFIEFYIYTAPHDDEYAMIFDVNWKFKEMVDYVCDLYHINSDAITEIRHTYVKRYKLTKDD